MVLRGNGFCPGHVTGFFSIHDRSTEISGRGSEGAGINLTMGAFAIATLDPPKEGNDDDLHLELNIHGDDDFKIDPNIYKGVLTRLLPDRGSGWAVSLRVRLQLPVGQGFGMSGAGAMATSIALWDAFHSHLKVWDRKIRFGAERERFISQGVNVGELDEFYSKILNRKDDDIGVSINYGDCVSAAHHVDVEVRGGLGDVVAQARGGIEVRLSAGIPPQGKIRNVLMGSNDNRKFVAVCVGKPIKTGDILTEPILKRGINRFGKMALKNFMSSPSMDRLIAESRNFSLKSGLSSSEIDSAIMSLEGREKASMMMIGNSAFTVIEGKNADKRVEHVERMWRDLGNIYICDIDTPGSRPVY
jgi:pantoate kinase